MLIGVGIAWGDRAFHLGAALAALAGALLLQVAANLANDYFDWKRGADDDRRVGPLRVVSAGLVSPRAMRVAMVLTLALIVPLAAYLAWRAGPAFVAIGAAAILFALLYTGGPWPLAYLGLGDVAAFAFFGPVAVAGTYAAQALRFDWLPVWAGVGPGALAVALLAINNLRDRAGDARANKRTLAVRFGAAFARAEIVLAVAVAAIVPLVLAALTGRWLVLAATGACLLAVPSLRAVTRGGEGMTLNRALAALGKVLLVYGPSFALGWAIWKAP